MQMETKAKAISELEGQVELQREEEEEVPQLRFMELDIQEVLGVEGSDLRAQMVRVINRLLVVVMALGALSTAAMA
jgi:hypothetical protein